MDEELELMKKIRQGSLSGNRVNSYEDQSCFEWPFFNAVRKAQKYLNDGQWHKIKKLEEIANNNDVDFDRLVNEIGAGLSDNDRWVCIEKLNTPEAPEGI